jgi:hypothetical protein
MIIKPKEPSEFAPALLTLEQVEVITTPGTSTPSTLFGVTSQQVVGGEGHYNINVVGFNLENGTVTGGDAALVDQSEFPLIKPNPITTDYANVKISNGRIETSPLLLRFKRFGALPTYEAPLTFANGSYAKYSHDIVNALVSASPDNIWLTGSDINSLNTRANLATFPHAAITGLSVTGLWPNGCKLQAVTKRHAFTAGHYGVFRGVGPIGRKVYWRSSTNGALVERTIIHSYRVMEDKDNGIDLAIVLLDSDLPEDIVPFPVAGQWACNADYNPATQTYITCPTYFGITVFNRDGHWQPTFNIGFEQYDNPSWFLPAGRNFNYIEYESEYTFAQMSPGFQGIAKSSASWDRYFGTPDYGYGASPPAKFAHNRIGGDSGSPTLIPVANGKWAICGSETGICPSKEGFDIIIAECDARAVAATALADPTGYTVIEATDPTL